MKHASLVKKYKFLQKGASEILFYVWDPIGVSPDPYARDEYDDYVSQVIRKLTDGANAKEIAAHLDGIAVEMMGLGPSESALAAAELLVDLKRYADEMLLDSEQGNN